MRFWSLSHIVSALAFAAGLARASAAHAQDLEEPHARQGYWVGAGLSMGGTNIIDKGKNKHVYGGSGFSLRLGQLITQRFGMGLLIEYNGIKREQDKGSAGGLGLEGNYNPWRNLGVNANIGFGWVALTDDATEEKELRGGAGPYLGLGASYDFFPWRNRLSGGWAVTPSINFRAMPDGDVHAYTVMVGLQVVRWSGLPRNMLILPEQ